MSDRRGSRFVLEVLFLLALAVALTLTNLSPLEIAGVMLVGWVVVALFEWAAWRDEPHYGSGLPPRYYVPRVSLPPAQPLEQVRIGYPEAQRDEAPTSASGPSRRRRSPSRRSRHRPSRCRRRSPILGRCRSCPPRRSTSSSKNRSPSLSPSLSPSPSPNRCWTPASPTSRSSSCAPCKASRATRSTRSPILRRASGSVAARRSKCLRSKCRRAPRGCDRSRAARIGRISA